MMRACQNHLLEGAPNRLTIAFQTFVPHSNNGIHITNITMNANMYNLFQVMCLPYRMERMTDRMFVPDIGGDASDAQIEI